MLKMKYKSTRASKAEAKKVIDFLTGKIKKLPKGWSQTTVFRSKPKAEK